jgi:hypothetical protein
VTGLFSISVSLKEAGKRKRKSDRPLKNKLLIPPGASSETGCKVSKAIASSK